VAREKLSHDEVTPRNAQYPTLAAAGHFLQFLRDTASITGYSPGNHVRIRELLDQKGVSGHEITLSPPRNGFTPDQKDSMQAYATSLTYWRKLLVEIDWEKPEVLVAFRKQGEETPEEAGQKAPLKARVKGRAYIATRAIADVLVSQGFMVREPIQVDLVTLKSKHSGWAVVVKYPGLKATDLAGVTAAYDKWVPRLADIFARQGGLSFETVREGQATTIFFTKDRSYVSTLYDTGVTFRILVPKKSGRLDLVFFMNPTYRACRALRSQYKKDFVISTRPMLAWGVSGHSLAMRYKPGAAGKIADDSYMWNVRLMAEKLMKKYRLQALVKHQKDSRCLVVTFYTGAADPWSSTPVQRGEAVVQVSGEREPIQTLN
jgi:hypothetical protein